MLGLMNTDLSSASLSVLKDVLTVGAQSPSPSVVSSDSASALPNWLLIALLALVTLIIVAMFSLTAYSLSASRSTLKNLIGRGNQAPPPGLVSPSLVRTLAIPDRGGRRTTRTILAIAGFSLLGLVVIAMFGLSGQGVRDLRSQVVASITTLVAAIAGFYFGAQKAGNNNASPGDVMGKPSGGDAPSLGPDPDPNNSLFTVGEAGTYVPILGGTPPPTVSVSSGTLPSGLYLNPATGVIAGTPASGTAGEYNIQLTARNGISPDGILDLRLSVTPTAPILST
jgi:Putative Ig domain